MGAAAVTISVKGVESGRLLLLAFAVCSWASSITSLGFSPPFPAVKCGRIIITPSMRLLGSWNTQATAWDSGREIRVGTQRCSEGGQWLWGPRNPRTQDPHTHSSRHSFCLPALWAKEQKDFGLDMGREKRGTRGSLRRSRWRPASPATLSVLGD